MWLWASDHPPLPNFAKKSERRATGLISPISPEFYYPCIAVYR